MSSLCRAVYHQRMNEDLHHAEQQSAQRQQFTGWIVEDPRHNPVGHNAVEECSWMWRHEMWRPGICLKSIHRGQMTPQDAGKGWRGQQYQRQHLDRGDPREWPYEHPLHSVCRTQPYRIRFKRSSCCSSTIYDYLIYIFVCRRWWREPIVRGWGRRIPRNDGIGWNGKQTSTC